MRPPCRPPPARRAARRPKCAGARSLPVQLPETPKQLASMRARLGERFPLDELREAKRKLDPKGVLGNTLIDTLLRE